MRVQQLVESIKKNIQYRIMNLDAFIRNLKQIIGSVLQ